MGTPTALVVTVSATEFSRYERGRDKITATVTATGGSPYSNVPIVVSLIKARRRRDQVVASQTVYITGTAPVTTSVVFDLPNIVDQDYINQVRHGEYFVQAQYPGANAEQSLGSGADGTVNLVVADVGVAGNSWTVESVVRSGDHPLGVVITGTDIKVNLAVSSGVPIALDNQAVLVSSVINQAGRDVIAAYTGNGSGSITAEGPLTFAGGIDPVVVDGINFAVRIVTIAAFKQDYLFGLTLRSTDIKFVNNPLQQITGVEILEVSGNSQLGFNSLAYTYDNGVGSLSWNGGPVVPITAPGDYILQSGANGRGAGCSVIGGVSTSSYIKVRITDLSLLPTHSVVEGVLVDYKMISDDTIARYLDETVSYMENDWLCIYLEPTRVTSTVDPTTIQFAAGMNAPTPLFIDTDWDVVRQPLTYYPKWETWVQIWTPFHQILRVDNLFGAISNVRVIDIDLDWVEESRTGGLIQLVPFNQAVAFNYLGLVWSNALRGAAEIPNFWNYDMVVGIRDCTADLRDYIGKKTAVSALLALGLAFRPGFGSSSLSRDGVSQSSSYLSGQKYGPYGQIIQGYMDWLKENEPKLKANYAGAFWAVV